MKKQKLPKYVQAIFRKPQFKVGDRVKFEFLGDHGWGYITRISKYNDKISYMVKGNGYSYPCGIQVKGYSSYYAGTIDFEASKNKRNHEVTRNTKIEKRNDNHSREQFSGSNSSSISNKRSGYKPENNIRTSNAENIQSNKRSRESTRNDELEDAIDKQKNFLRKFT